MRRFVQSLICVIMLGLKRLCVGFQPRFRSVPQVRRTLSSVEKTFLDVPFESKDEVKALGARWDVEAKKWFVPAGVNPSVFQDFLKVYISVPINEKKDAKVLGAKWDKEKSKWFVVSSNVAALSRWTVVSSMEGSSEPLSSSKAADSFSAEFPASKDAVMVLSVDTNGLPVQDKGQYLTYEDLSAYDSCRIIQISYNLCRLSDMSPLESESFIIQSDGFPIDNTEFHGITLDESQSTGIPFSEAADKVFQAMEKSDNVLSHNADFVHSVFRSELFRNGLLDHIHVFDHKKRWCSMELTKDILGLVDKRGSPKPPSLKELVQSTGGEDLPAQRNSQQNAEFLRSSLQVLVNTGKLIVPFKAY